MVDPLSGGVPILLSDSVVMAQGETRLLSARNLQTQYRNPMMIDSINFQLTFPFTGIGGVSQALGGSVSARFRMGQLDISDRFIPIWLHGPRLSDWSSDPEGTAPNLGTFLPDTTNRGWSQHFRWILPKPLYVPAGSVLLPNIARGLDNLNGNVTVNVSYAGRRLPVGSPQPKEIDVAFICAFLPAANATEAWSNARDLYNPFQVPLQVQRFTGRVYSYANNGSVSGDATENLGALVYPGLVRIQDSDGYNLLRENMPFGQAFDVNRRAWTFSRVLGPKQWYTVQLSDLTSGADAEVVAQTNYQIAMIGTRKETLQ